MSKRKVPARERMGVLANDKQYRKELFNGLLKHIESGYSINCYPELSEDSISLCIKEYPDEFVHSELEDAVRKAEVGWQELGRKQANGTCLGNSASWKFIMAHKYRWTDKIDVNMNHSGAVNVSVINYATQPLSDGSHKVPGS